MTNENERDERLRLIEENKEVIKNLAIKHARELIASSARNKQGYPITQQQWDRAIRLIEDWLRAYTDGRATSESVIRVEIEEARAILNENNPPTWPRD